MAKVFYSGSPFLVVMSIQDKVNIKVGVDSVRLHYSAREWARFHQRTFFDKILDGLLSRGYVVPESREPEIRCVLEEAVLNSQSACGERDDLTVTLVAAYISTGLDVSISDEGPGFDYRKKLTEARRLAPTRDRSLLFGERGSDADQGGVGLYALLTCVDSFKYSRGGRKLDVRFDLEKDEPSQNL